MRLIQALVGLVFTLAFFILLFLVAWYIALPVLIIVLAVGAFSALRTKLFGPKEHVEHLVMVRKKPKKKEQVIDVDYTEV